MGFQAENKKRIARNTILLYFRMILVMLVSLFTSRVLLNTLGVVDYGIQNVVGGLVSMFSMISASIGTTIVRFLTFELGGGDKEKLATTFSTAINIQFICITIILLLAEIIGVWFLNYKMIIPHERIIASNWVFQLSLASFCVGLVGVPYNSLLIAREKMDVFAYFSICDVLLKLFIVYLLTISPFDKLIYYSILLFSVAVLVQFFYGFYCYRYYPESRYRFVLDNRILIEMGKFTGWNYIGAGTFILRTHGLNILMNLFFGVTINAARGIASQVETAVNQCIRNFSIALSPQITKSYARKDYDYMYSLICYGAKYTFFLVLVIIIPLLFETPLILELWLKIVPESTVIFTRLTLLLLLDNCICNTLTDALLASGDIKKLHIMVGCVVTPVIPISYLLFSLGAPPYSCYILCIAALIIKFCFEISYAREIIGLPISLYFSKVLMRVIPVLITLPILPFGIYLIMEQSVVRLIILIITSVLWSGIILFYIGLEKKEKMFVIQRVKTILNYVKMPTKK